mmetsp:Transcript_16015/g.33864  ORF Transcript_16015/g.33864 Transcript_16015/m.33864 type:complete len:215 (-) Transcript_16015:195-839(-)
MREHPHHLRETMRLHHVQKLERFHLKPEFRIHAEQHEVGHLGRIEHRRGSIRTFHQSNAARFRCAHGNRTSGIGQIVIGVHLYETAYQCALAHARGTHHGDQRGRTLLDSSGASIARGDVFLLLGAVEITLDGALGAYDVGDREGAGVVIAVLEVAIAFFLFADFGFATAAAGFGGSVGAVVLIVGVVCRWRHDFIDFCCVGAGYFAVSADQEA